MDRYRFPSAALTVPARFQRRGSRGSLRYPRRSARGSCGWLRISSRCRSFQSRIMDDGRPQRMARSGRAVGALRSRSRSGAIPRRWPERERERARPKPSASSSGIDRIPVRNSADDAAPHRHEHRRRTCLPDCDQQRKFLTRFVFTTTSAGSRCSISRASCAAQPATMSTSSASGSSSKSAPQTRAYAFAD